MIGKERTSSSVSGSRLLRHVALSHKLQKLRLQFSPPPPLISTWRGSDYIFGGFVDKLEIKMSQASSFSHVRAPELSRT